LKHVELITCN